MVPEIEHVATVVSLLTQDNVPSPVLVIVLVPLVPYVKVPLVGFIAKLLLAFPIVIVYVASFVTLVTLSFAVITYVYSPAGVLAAILIVVPLILI